MKAKIEIRKDFFLDRYCIISHSRKLRPKEYKDKGAEVNVKKCFFCPGNEEPELEIGRLEKNGKWLIRWIRNKYPALLPDFKSVKIFKNGIYERQLGYGFHEVIVDTPKHGVGIFELSVKEITQIFKVYQMRYKALKQKEGISYVVLFKNFGPKSGASIVHDHTQVIAQPSVPEMVKELATSFRKLKRDYGCPVCYVIKKEMRSARRVTSNKHFVSFVPYAPRFANELWVLPRRHILFFEEFTTTELESLASIMKKLLTKVMKLTDSFNYVFYPSPSKQKDMHFHIEIYPRTSIWAGYEFATNRYIISIPPERSAEFYRD